MSLIFPLLTFPYVSRILGPTNLGIINFAQSYGYYFTHIASFGISSYAIREVSKVRDDKEKVDKLSNELFNLNLFFSVISTILYFCGVFLVEKYRENFTIFALYSIVIFTNFLSLEWLLQSYDDYFFSTIRNLVIRIISIVAVFVFIHRQEDYFLYMLISCIAEMGTKISTLIYCRDNYAGLKIRTGFLNFKEHFKPMFTLFSFRLVNGISSNLDKLMIGFIMLYSDVGVYSAGVKIILMIQPIVETVGIVLFPKINISSDSQYEYKRNLNINYNLILVMGIPMSVGLFLISPRIVLLASGEQYYGAISVSRIMSMIILFGPIADMLGSKTLLVYKKDKQFLLCSAIVAISNFVLNAILIPSFGINGAATASMVCCMITVLLRYYFSRKIIDLKFINLSFIKYILFTIPFMIVYWLFRVKIDNYNTWMFGFVGLCILIYISELIISKDEHIGMLMDLVFNKGKKNE